MQGPVTNGASASIFATDGIALAARVYEPVQKPSFDMLILPGIGVPQRLFRHLGTWLAGEGVRVVSIDYRGMGESTTDPRALATASLTNWARCDAVGALRFVEETGSGAPIVLLGHSFGGQALGFSDEFRRVAAAILVGSGFGQARHRDGIARVELAAYWRVLLPAAAAIWQVVPPWVLLGQPLPRGVAREWARWGRTRDWLLPHVDHAEARYAAFDRPIRAYAIADDDIAPPRAVADLLRNFRQAPLERIDIGPRDLDLPSLGHVGLFRPGQAQLVWREFLAYGSRATARAPTDANPRLASRGCTACDAAP
jgi:predicted alpha/beta hydrolase